MKARSYMNWSGGKDSSLCLHYILQDARYSVDCLLTSVNAAHNRISMHGVRRELLEQQAEAIGLPSHAVFGDIFLEDLKRYREEKLQTVDMQAVFPLWKIPTKQLMDDFLRSGFKAVIVCVNEKFLDKSFCGRLIDESFVRDLPANVDVCGENGEYHSYVFDGPVFKYPVPYIKGEIVERRYSAPQTASNTCNPMDKASDYSFYFCDLLPV
jgi:diphthamide synthase (EF-2-diphthine--ammonia ligase)